MKQRWILLNIIKFLATWARNLTVLPQNNKVWPIYLDNLTQLIILIQRKWIYAYLSANIDITNIFQFLAVFAQKYTISPKMNNVWLTSTLHYNLTICHTVSYHCARFYTSKPTNIETTNIFRFLTIFFT